jgi:hypothetical protein
MQMAEHVNDDRLPQLKLGPLYNTIKRLRHFWLLPVAVFHATKGRAMPQLGRPVVGY